MLPDLKQLKRLLKSDHSALPAVKVALLGDSATQLLATALRGMGVASGLNIDLFEADYNQVEQQLSDPESDLHAFAAEYIIIFQSTHKLALQHAAASAERQQQLASERIAFISAQAERLRGSGTKLIVCNYPEIDDTVFGSYANRVESSLTWQVRQLNLGLMELSLREPSLLVCDLCALQAKMGRDRMFAPNIYTSTEMVISVEALPYVASRMVDIICALRGQIKKCLILDLDNTAWGGVIGDDGIEGIQLGHGLGIGKAFSEFQLWVRKLKQRGIIICVASKNDESTAKEPFLHHPDMVLRLSDIAVFQANWETKVDNIRTIQQVLNIGFDSMVFLDDNPFERAMVREHIEGITVPELPTDPAEYLEYLYGLNLFETASYSTNDADRTQQYQIEAERMQLSKSFGSEAEFLQQLGMRSTVSGFTKFNVPRVAQLTQRSNQFNLRTIRYTEDDIAALAADPEVVDLCFTLSDRLGDNGLVAVVIMRPVDGKTLFVDSWLMSCRVLKRGMEAFTLNAIVQAARTRGYSYIVGEYLPTAKNHMVANHYPSLGFTAVDGSTQQWTLAVDGYTPRECYIELDNGTPSL